VRPLFISSQEPSNGRSFFWVLKFVVVLAALTAVPMSASTQIAAETGRIQITLVKTGYGGGSGILFYEGKKYGLGISGTKLKGIWIRRVDLIGTVLNIRSERDIIGTFSAVDDGAAFLEHSKMARIKNPKGVILEVQGVNLSRNFSLNLSGMTIANLGWQASTE
jgi:hypothetical protein